LDMKIGPVRKPLEDGSWFEEFCWEKLELSEVYTRTDAEVRVRVCDDSATTTMEWKKLAPTCL